MTVLALEFAGWFQCRLATDPDPPDEPRGVSGFTFALPGEPDFDRIIRFHEPVMPRSHCPEVGVFVQSVSSDGELLEEHPLAGGRVELVGDSRFESRNQVLRDTSRGPIVPFHLRIVGDRVTLEREDILFPPNPSCPLVQVPSEFLARRGSQIPFMIDRLKVADATGIRDPLAWRAQRQRALEADLPDARRIEEKLALEARIRQLEITDPERKQVLTLLLCNDTRFDLNGPVHLSDPQGRLESPPDGRSDWPLAFWMGAWDSDALCGYVRGILTLPLET